MINSETKKLADRIRTEMKNSGYTKKVWSAALKTAFRYDSLSKVPEYDYQKKTWTFTKKSGDTRTIDGVYNRLINETTIQFRDLAERGKFKSFRIWQLLPKDEAAQI